jgi:hypothetical protein
MYRHIVEISDNIYIIKDGHIKLIQDLIKLETYRYLSLETLE